MNRTRVLMTLQNDLLHPRVDPRVYKNGKVIVVGWPKVQMEVS